MPSGTSYSIQKSQLAFPSFDKLVEHYSNKLDDRNQLGVLLKSEYSRARQVKISAGHVGARVAVAGYEGEGTMLFYGNHQSKKGKRVGVRLDLAVGNNNGTVGGHKYFRCDAGHGVLVSPKKVNATLSTNL